MIGREKEISILEETDRENLSYRAVLQTIQYQNHLSHRTIGGNHADPTRTIKNSNHYNICIEPIIRFVIFGVGFMPFFI